jgi:hypothetical protein
MIPVIGLVLTSIGLIVSVSFNVIQLRQRHRQDRRAAQLEAERQRQDEERREEQRRKEQAPPQFYNLGGRPGAIVINGVQHSSQGPFMDFRALVTVVNATQTPVKVGPTRLILDGEEWPVKSFFFRLKENPRDRFERISLRGNDKEDYELHVMFPDNKYPTPPTHDGEIWFSSDNRAEEFAVPIRCP